MLLDCLLCGLGSSSANGIFAFLARRSVEDDFSGFGNKKSI
jgi:hypothetical protein